MLISIFYFMFFAGIFSFFFNCKFLLLMLLSLEFIFLSLYLGLFFFLFFYLNEFYFISLYLTFMVCEGVLGLSLLVLMIRSFGNDLYGSLNCLW